MEATKFIKPGKLVEYYDQEIREALFCGAAEQLRAVGYGTIAVGFHQKAFTLGDPVGVDWSARGIDIERCARREIDSLYALIG